MIKIYVDSLECCQPINQVFNKNSYKKKIDMVEIMHKSNLNDIHGKSSGYN